jgi:hypothetical protein
LYNITVIRRELSRTLLKQSAGYFNQNLGKDKKVEKNNVSGYRGSNISNAKGQKEKKGRQRFFFTALRHLPAMFNIPYEKLNNIHGLVRCA